MSERQRLPDRRDSDFLTFDHMGQTVHVSASRYETGRIAEVFFNAGKSGTAIDIVMREMATVVSIALQSGVPLGVIEGSLPKLVDGAAAGPLGKALALLQEPWAPRTVSGPDVTGMMGDGAP
ncbi:MAG: hypothetical protein KGL35_08245 [Bradyrhizobium sp.]|nr:hypothetical protein [Bradyrhizobium sp.]